MGHLALKIGGKYMTLPPDTSIDYEDVNPLFNDNVESGAYPFALPFKGNRKVLENMDTVASDKRAIDLEKKSGEVVVDGVPFRSGVVEIGEGQELKDEMEVTIKSVTGALADLYADMNCQEVPVKDRIQIGQCIGDVTPDYVYDVRAQVTVLVTGFHGGGFQDFVSTPMSSTSPNNVIQFPAVGFSIPYSGSSTLEECVNTSDAYPTKQYCNARVCYPHHKVDDEGNTGNEIDQNDPLMVLEANRPGSGVCFYVLYFLDCLFKALGVNYINTNLLTVEDLKRLAFYTTRCEYDMERYPDFQYLDYDYYGIDQINDQLDWWQRHTPDSIKLGRIISSEQSQATIAQGKKERKRLTMTPDLPGYTGGEIVVEVGKPIDITYYPEGPGRPYTIYGRVSKITMLPDSVNGQTKAKHMKMFANSKNFPDKSVSSVIDSLWSSFGIRFVYNAEERTVKPLFVRDVFRDQSAPIKLNCKVLSATPVTEKITGVRMRYAAESDPQDQSKNVRDGVRDYDTAYDYLMEASPINDDYTYSEILNTAGVSNTLCYVDLETGYAYRWKVDKDARTVSEMNVRLFEVGAFKGVEVGDCSKKNEDYIVDLTSDFEPLVMTDANYRNEKEGATDTLLVPFADVDMKNEKEHCQLTYALGTDMVNFPLTVEIRTDESYDPNDTEEGDSPLSTYDWGMSVGVMRGGGSDAEIMLYDFDYDGFGNQKYRTVSGNYAFTTDTIDQYGNVYDYNGTSQGDGGGERFSLKIRGYHIDPETGEPIFSGSSTLMRRGLYDAMMSEYVHFLLNRKKVILRVLCEVAELVDIPNNWDKRYQIGRYVGWINRVKTHITNQDGLDETEIEMYTL
jgi:hypothetical protein